MPGHTGFVVYDEDGDILRSGQCSVDVLQYQGDNVLAIPVDLSEEISDLTHKVQNGIVVARAIRLHNEPFPNSQPKFITPAQLFIALAKSGFITNEEALAAASVGAMPASVSAAVASLPESERLAVQISWARMSLVYRTDALVSVLASAQQKTPEEMDAFFALASTM